MITCYGHLLWKGYYGLNSLGFDWDKEETTVNHSENFVKPGNSKVYTQVITFRNMWDTKMALYDFYVLNIGGGIKNHFQKKLGLLAQPADPPTPPSKLGRPKGKQTS